MESDRRQRHEMTTTSSTTTHSATTQIPFLRRLGKKSTKENNKKKKNGRKKSGATISRKESRSGPAQHNPRPSALFSSTTAARTSSNYEHRTGLEPQPSGGTASYMAGQVVEAQSEFASIVPTLTRKVFIVSDYDIAESIRIQGFLKGIIVPHMDIASYKQ